MFNTLKNSIKKWFSNLTKAIKGATDVYRPAYRIASIDETDDNDYLVTVHTILKNAHFFMKPEEILADDKMTDLFSPRDVRTLTYLGYLGINSPKYKILAQRLSAEDNRIIFALHKKGEKKPRIKTAFN